MSSMTPTFDYDESLRRMGDDVQLFREMVGLLQEDGPLRMSEARRGLAARDAARIVHAAHTLKGLAANFSAARAVAAAAWLEQLARDEEWREMEAAMEELDDALAELLASLERFRAAAR